MIKKYFVLYISFLIIAFLFSYKSYNVILDFIFYNAAFAFLTFLITILYFENFLAFLSYPFVTLPKLFSKKQKVLSSFEYIDKAKNEHKEKSNDKYFHLKMFLFYMFLELLFFFILK